MCVRTVNLFYQHGLKKSSLSLGTLIFDVLCLKSGCLYFLLTVGLNCNYEPLLAFCSYSQITILISKCEL